MKRRRKEVASKSELEFRLAILNWYLQRLEEWAKRTHDFCNCPIAASTRCRPSKPRSCSRLIDLGRSVPMLPSVAAKAEKGGYAAVDKCQNPSCFRPRNKALSIRVFPVRAILRHLEPVSGSIGRI